MLWDLSILGMKYSVLVWLLIPSIPTQPQRGSGTGEQQGGSWGPTASLLAQVLGLDRKDKVRSILA